MLILNYYYYYKILLIIIITKFVVFIIKLQTNRILLFEMKNMKTIKFIRCKNYRFL